MKNKGTIKNSELQRKVKSLQDQITNQGDIITSMGVQIAELVRELKAEKEERSKLLSGMAKEPNASQLCSIIRRIDHDLNELKDQHIQCRSLGKTVDELGALCAAAMVAAGSKLHESIAERQSQVDTPKTPDAGPQHRESTEERRAADTDCANFRDTQEKPDARPQNFEGTAERRSAGANDVNVREDKCSGHNSSESTSVEDDDASWTLVKRKRRRRKAFRNGAVLIGGENVRRIRAAAREEFNFDRNVIFSSQSDSISDINHKLVPATRNVNADEVDVVIHLDGSDIMNFDADNALEGLSQIINVAKEQHSIREVIVCSMIERRDAGQHVTDKARLVNDQLGDLCATYRARFLDLRNRLGDCAHQGINRTGWLYTWEGARNVSQVITSKVYGFLD